MATRNIRPRVLTAINDLGTFTIAELCRAAGLTDRNQAYAQLDRLKERGFLEQKTLPASGPYAPLKQYTLVSNQEKRSEFAGELAAYRPSPPVWAESGLAKLAMEEARRELDNIDQSLLGIEEGRGNDAAKQLAALDGEFDTALTNIKTAQLEYAGLIGREETSLHPVNLVAERWRKADTKRKNLRTALERPVAVDWAPMLRSAARAVNRSILAGDVSSGGTDWVSLLSKTLSLISKNGEYRAPMEMLLDEIRADPAFPFAPVFRHALRTGDAKVLFEVVRIFKDIDLPWWQYNRENACYLKTSRLRTKEWLLAYESLRARISIPPEAEFKVYSYALEGLTQDVYLNVTREHGVSVVSPREVGFLGASEVVRPTMIIESGNMFRPVDCSFLNPNGSLYAYGPIANDVACWQGAPDLRVVACLGMWGLPLDDTLSKITRPLKNNRGLLVMQGKPGGLTPDSVTILQAEQIGESAV